MSGCTLVGRKGSAFGIRFWVENAPLPLQIAQIAFAFMAVSAHSFRVMSDHELILDAVQEMPPSASFSDIMDELMLLLA